MEWIRTTEHPLVRYVLVDDTREVAELTVDYRSAPLRAACAAPAGPFLIDREGAWKNRVIVRSPYGGRLAALQPERWYSHTWTIADDNGGGAVRMRWRNNPLAELAFFAGDDSETPLLTYGLKATGHTPRVEIGQGAALHGHALREVLICLGWYLFLPVAQENVVEFAA